MKAIERQTVGYSERCLEDFFRGTLFPSSFFNQPVPVRGVCFAAGAESSKLAREFAEVHLRLGTIGLRMDAMTTEAWRGITNLLTRPRAEVSKVGFLLHDLDLTPPELQEKIADAIDATDNVVWLATARDPRMLSPKLKLSFLVYLGVGPNGKMRFLAQDGQRLLIDEGSLEKP